MTKNNQGRARGVAIMGARGLLGIAGVVVAGASIFAATLIPLPQIGAGPTSTVVSPVAASQQRICAGPALQLGDDTGLEATTAISIGKADVTSASTSGSPSLEDLDATDSPTNTPPQRLLLAPPPAGEEPGALAGSQSQRVEGEETAGFSASECVKPELESWLVGGSTITGRTTLISLNNPSKVNATVKLTIYSESGRVDAVGTEGIVVPAGGHRVFSLAGFAPGIASPVVHVESSGGQVSAALQQSIVRTLTPGGIDVVTASTDPAPLTVIPGVVIAGDSNIAAVTSLNGYSDLDGILRVFVPGEGKAEITVAALAEDGSGATSSATFAVQGDTVTDFPLDEFTDGTWTLTVSSDRAAIAAARTSTVTLKEPAVAGVDAPLPTTDDVLATDFAWFVSAPALVAQTLVSVAPGPSAIMHFVNTGSTDAVVTIDALEGAGTTVTVPAGLALAVPVAANASYRVGGTNTVRISVSYQDAGVLAGFTVSPPDRSSQSVTVFNQYG